MSDQMAPIPFEGLMQWILTEYAETGGIFGVKAAYHASAEKTLPLFDACIEAPFGPAAGPHTQLAQNIVSAYFAGARFFELKTVQIMDGEELRKCVQKPCILAEDEGYNCEWSTELTAEQALDEYVKAWFICKLLAYEFGLGGENGFIFNMSVGYDYAGITSPKIDRFIEGLKDAEDLPIFHECRQWAFDNLHLFDRVNARYIESISSHVCNSITLSTLHGCPPQEIERIAAYLMETKKLHTFVKCNPTILGYETARRILDHMGYDYIAFDNHHFREDLQFEDAIPMFLRLNTLSHAHGLEFGLKLSNTFPVDVRRNELPSEEMYMSGRALFPLTMEMASRFANALDGRLRLSFSGGADAFNIHSLFHAGIWPITLATTLLKPGGYERLTQLATLFGEEKYTTNNGISVARVEKLALAAQQDPRHRKPAKPIPPKKIGGPLPLANCFTAPCKSGCPIGQDIPEYVSLVSQGRHLAALRVITEKNPLPYITGQICPHHCTDTCMRGYYEEPIRIRNAKLEAVRGGYEALIGEVSAPAMTSSSRAAVIGGGPAGLATAFFLSRAGMPVTLYEQREKPGGIVRYVIPEFRILTHGIDRDVQLVEKMGVRFKLGKPAPTLQVLKEKGYAYIIVATGAWKHGALHLAEGEAMNVLTFLEAVKNGSMESVGETVCIVGGGNSAMDAARAAKRLPGVKTVQIVYRRTRKYMPAEEEELDLCRYEGVEFLELLSPVSFTGGTLTCRKMVLGDPDASGRRSPVETEEMVTLPCDLLIAATGERVDTRFLQANGISIHAEWGAVYDADTLMTNLPGVYIAGDVRRGPSTVVEAIADARRIADHITGEHTYDLPPSAFCGPAESRSRRGNLEEYINAAREGDRCLYCSASCEICAQVCPNRANVALSVPGFEMRQILHVDRMCNECGNCAVFCPYEDAPYLKKPTLFHTPEEFETSDNDGFLHLGEKRFHVRFGTMKKNIDLDGGETELPPEMEALLGTLCEAYGYLLRGE